ncbi:hypothetical protein BCR33DRAFT_766619 [Rhizoclosmatium globosum]|uniref:Uncharacterized protein n=1 Tax=Rhizoclosmatium globosum TaxID=329046 RepID=A0A1Y2C993_9FUNG|nr:hypothetical protein BCR33DRAFT_766619 [Rhizoclosmatium globosum]|eukprot:ORY43424.1 hypothetical protein BCR33DRAFT_766619 [Rhizoclosmatium globosum]
MTNQTTVDTTPKSIPSIVILSTASFLSLIGFTYLIWFVVTQEIPKRSKNESSNIQSNNSRTVKKSTLKILFSPFNISLGLMALSLVGYYASSAARPYFEGFQFHVLNTMVGVFFSAIESTYVYYSWKRGMFVVKRVFKQLATVLSYSIYVITPIIHLQPVPNIILCVLENRVSGLNLKLFAAIGNGLVAFAGVCVIGFDVLLLAAFIKYVRRADDEGLGLKADRKLTIICQYGIAADVISITALLIYALYALKGSEIAHIISELEVGLIFALLLAMKLRLFRQENTEEQNLQDRINAKSEKCCAVSKSEAERTASVSATREEEMRLASVRQSSVTNHNSK